METFIQRHIGRHANSPDRNAAGGIVDDKYRAKTRGRTVDVNDTRRAEAIGKAEITAHIFRPPARNSMEHQHRELHTLQYPLREAAEYQFAQAAMAVAAHDKQICADVMGRLGDRVWD